MLRASDIMAGERRLEGRSVPRPYTAGPQTARKAEVTHTEHSGCARCGAWLRRACAKPRTKARAALTSGRRAFKVHDEFVLTPLLSHNQYIFTNRSYVVALNIFVKASQEFAFTNGETDYT